jgi:hypothetical protein
VPLVLAEGPMSCRWCAVATLPRSRQLGDAALVARAEQLTPRDVFKDDIDRIRMRFVVPTAEAYALRHYDILDPVTGEPDPIPHLSRGVSPMERWTMLEDSVRESGVIREPIEIDFGPNKDGPYVKDGHHRLGIATRLGMPAVPVLVPRGIAVALGWYRPGMDGLGDAGGMSRSDAFALFKDAVRHVWKNADFVLPALEMSDEPPAEPVLASIAFAGQPFAIGRSLLTRSTRYTLRVNDELLTRPRDDVWKILVHEAVHLGYRGHGPSFREVARESGGVVSASALTEGDGVKVQKKVGARYQTMKTFPTEREALTWGKEQQSAEPGSRWRIEM